MVQRGESVAADAKGNEQWSGKAGQCRAAPPAHATQITNAVAQQSRQHDCPRRDKAQDDKVGRRQARFDARAGKGEVGRPLRDGGEAEHRALGGGVERAGLSSNVIWFTGVEKPLVWRLSS